MKKYFIYQCLFIAFFFSCTPQSAYHRDAISAKAPSAEAPPVKTSSVQQPDSPKENFTVSTSEELLGLSVEKRKITKLVYGSAPKPVLIIGGIHGDETAAISLTKMFVDKLNNDEPIEKTCSVVVVPVINPDGVALKTRTNANNVDINRNFDTNDWNSKRAKRKRYNAGSAPGSEPETRILMEIIESLKPARIVVIHSPLRLINFDGPPEAEDLAHEMSNYTKYKVVASIGYPTPGSIGTYAGVERDIPVITFELSASPSSKEMEHAVQALYAAVKFKRCDKN